MGEKPITLCCALVKYTIKVKKVPEPNLISWKVVAPLHCVFAVPTVSQINRVNPIEQKWPRQLKRTRKQWMRKNMDVNGHFTHWKDQYTKNAAIVCFREGTQCPRWIWTSFLKYFFVFESYINFILFGEKMQLQTTLGLLRHSTVHFEGEHFTKSCRHH